MMPPTSSLDPSGQAQTMPMPQWDMPMRPGARGEVVATLQAFLVRRGFPIKVDGEVGPQTMRAVESAFVNLVESRSIVARRLTAAGYAGMSVGQVQDVLVRGYAALDSISGATQSAVSTQPSEPDGVVVMTPVEAAAFEKRIKGEPPPWKTAAFVGGAGLLAWTLWRAMR